jgi:hypothetical protein
MRVVSLRRERWTAAWCTPLGWRERWQLIAMDRPRRVARLSIGGRDVAARSGTYSTVAVGWADSFTEERGNGGGV